MFYVLFDIVAINYFIQVKTKKRKHCQLKNTSHGDEGVSDKNKTNHGCYNSGFSMSKMSGYS